MRKKSRLIAIVGPTASGKSELAVRIAKKFNGEVISVDSRQIYQGLTIGTGKVPGRWRRGIFMYRGIPHYLIDEVNPRRQYSIADFKKEAEKKIRDITKRRKIPILAGGTAFWIDSVVYDLNFPEVPPNRFLRRKLAKRTSAQLLAHLRRFDPARAETIEKTNPRRLIRAIEIAKALGKVPKLKRISPYDVFWIGVQRPVRDLKQRIRRRLQKRLKNGMAEEVKRLRKQKLSWRRLRELGLEYRYLSDYLQGKLTKKEMMAELESATWQYARRQMGWWRRNPKIHWVRNLAQAEILLHRLSVPAKRSKE